MIFKFKYRIKKINKILLNCPQKKGICIEIKIKTPRKPNSAKRAICKLFILKKKYINSFIPGIGHNLKKFSISLIAGQGVNDLPGINFFCIRGKFDLNGVINRKTSRSFYGISLKKKI